MLRCSFPAVLHSQAGLPQNPSGGPAARRRHGWSGRWLRAGARDQVEPREDFQFSFLQKGLIPNCPTQIRARQPWPTVLDSGVTLTRAHRDSNCLNLNTGQPELSSRCLFLNRLAVRRHIAGSKLCFKARLPPNPSGGPAWRRHGWSGWRRRAGAGRSTPATR